MCFLRDARRCDVRLRKGREPLSNICLKSSDDIFEETVHISALHIAIFGSFGKQTVYSDKTRTNLLLSEEYLPYAAGTFAEGRFIDQNYNARGHQHTIFWR